jgi:hypothetical protein
MRGMMGVARGERGGRRERERERERRRRRGGGDITNGGDDVYIDTVPIILYIYFGFAVGWGTLAF